MSTPQWVADLDIDAARATSLVRAHVAGLDVKSLEPFGNGWDNTAFLVNGAIVFRFPRRKEFAHLIEREAAVLPFIADALPLAISAPRYLGAPSADYPYVFAGYPLIAGRTACAQPLSDAQRSALAVPLARFLRALHGLETAPVAKLGIPEDELGRLDHAKLLPRSRARLATIREAGIEAGGDVFGDWLEAHPPRTVPREAIRLVHGDLYPRHVILNEQMLPAGVIDWGDVHLGDPALDLAIAHQLLPQTAHAAFREAYGVIAEPVWNAARWRAIYHAILEIEYGVSANDAAMRDMGLVSLRNMRAAIAGS